MEYPQQNAGAAILWPFLEKLFERTGLIKEGVFINDESQKKAVQLILFGVMGREALNDQDSIAVAKVLCGISLSDNIEFIHPVTSEEANHIYDMLLSLLEQWDKMKNTSIDSLREMFLRREGEIIEHEDYYRVLLPQKPYDALIQTIPWNVRNVRLPFMQKEIVLRWS